MQTSFYIPSVAHPTHCSYPPRSGNRVSPLIDSAPAFARIKEAIERVRNLQ
jgi:hypothetical protein